MNPRRGAGSLRSLELATLIIAISSTLAYGQEWRPAIGSWVVVERGPTAPADLSRFEIRPRGRGTDLSATAFERDRQGNETTRGVGKLERVANDPTRAYLAEWNEAGLSWKAMFRPAGDGHLSVVVRSRDPSRINLVPERVFEVVARFESRPAEERPAVNSPTPRPLERIATPDSIGVFLASPDGRSVKNLAPPVRFVSASHPCWAPDSRKVAFTAFDSTRRAPLIRIVDVEDGSCFAVAAGIAPSWSHDGKRIAYVAAGKPEFAVDWDRSGRNDERIEAVDVAGPEAGRVEILSRGLWPRYSPRDDRIAFVQRIESNWDVYVRSADGADQLRLTNDPALDTDPLWTSDATAILFLSDRQNRWDLYQQTADGKGMSVRVTNHPSREDRASLSPDGSTIAFHEAAKRAGSSILLLDRIGGSARPLLTPGNGDRDPAWSPDGQWVAFVSRR